MAPRIVDNGGSTLYNALRAEGFDLPDNCGDVEMEWPVDGPYRLRYSILVDDKQMEQIGRALIGIAQKTRG